MVRARHRDDLFITVPSFFRCPISLDVMTSPVSLCTGVTYDRASIQRWLDGGNNTCPATMQVLHSRDFVPNLTLQRLIRIWSDSARPADQPPPPPPDSPPSRDRALAAARSVAAGGAGECADALPRILWFASESEENRGFLARIEGFPSALLRLLDFDGDESERRVRSLELVVRVLGMVSSKLEDRESFASAVAKSDRRCLDSILMVIERGKSESKVAAVRILESAAIDAEKKLAMAECEQLLLRLLNLVAPETDLGLLEASLSCLIQISVSKRAKTRLVALRTIGRLARLLSAPSLTVPVTEKALKLLEVASSVKEGRAALCSDAACLESVLQKVFKVSGPATEHAVATLWSVCCLFGDQRAREVVAECNGVAKMLLLMQSNSPAPVRQMAGDLLRTCKVSSRRPCLSSYDTKTTHIMPF
ncbi:U-box domain-containing protein 27-like [Rhodamnia argentea]|uniref:U-box domain-containing protein n=1 Tax=Rhodamnia argentea TaxID=178133 RepID=A0A8B8Q9B4_9MYRT|nr:U-box domain-containing protein 27-like [Rhodamnia argentea]